MSRTTKKLPPRTPLSAGGLAVGKAPAPFPIRPLPLRPRPSRPAAPTWEELLGRR